VGAVIEGYIRELKHAYGGEIPIRYLFQTDQTELSINEYLGQQISISYTRRKACVNCGRSVKKLYQNGYCYPCMTTLAECDLCIVKPHDCHFHKGTCRDEEFAESHCMIPHYVYLAYSSNIKVGLTRKGRQFTRWVDQGALAAVLVAELPTRKQAGELEMEIAKTMQDKTDWRKMLVAKSVEEVDLLSVRADVIAKLTDEYQGFVLTNEPIHQFSYPALPDHEVKLSSLALDKQETVTGRLLGMKGQYMILDTGVFNVRKHNGFHVQVSIL
jgi:hypothetical protein